MPRFMSALRAPQAKAGPMREAAVLGRARMQAKEILLAAWYDAYGRMPDLGKPGDVKKLVRHYERCVWGYRAVEWVAGNASMLRIGARLRSSTGMERPEERVLPLLNERANPYERAMFFRHRLMQQLLTSPRGVFVEREKNRRDDVAWFHLLPPRRTRAVPGRSLPGQPAKFVDHYEVAPADGYGKVRRIKPENVIWIRLPHPDDPYRSMTPFEAADMSLELDYFARLYNRNFMHNDGRPGGVLGIDSDLDDVEMDRVERKFGGGVQDAGRLAVVAGGLSYVDTSATPRDAQYVEVARVAKIEVLGAIGVSEASLGNSSDRTFSNAEVDDESSWLNQLPRLRFVADAFDEDSADDVELFHDVSTVDALGRAARRDREEMRKEVDGGERSVDEYREARGEEPFGTPASRALWLPAGRVPVAADGDDQAELLALASPAPAAPPKPETAAGTGDDRPPLPANAPGRGDPDAEKRDKTTGREPPFSGAAPESKAEPKPSDGGSTYEPDEDDGLDVERTLVAALLASAAKLVGIAEARLAGPKVLQHTRHWKPPGDRAFDAAKVVQAARWTEACKADADRVLAPAAAAAAEDLLSALAEPEGKALPKDVAAAVKAAVDDAAAMVGKSAARQAELLLDLIAETEAGGASVPEIVAAVRKFAKGQAGWASGVAVQAVTAALEGGRAAAAAGVKRQGRVIVRRWRTRGDEKVRTTHRKANGQEVGLREAFDVGGVALRYPGDPRAPFKETANCFPAGTLVRALDVEAAFRRWYEGETVTVHTADGHVLTGTPNHPVLAERGWVALGEVEEGDNLVCEVEPPRAGLVRAALPDVQDSPAVIDEVHRAAQQAGVLARVAGSGVDFHGDGREGEIDVVRADRPLHVGVPAARGQEPGEANLAAADALKRALAAERAGGEFVVGGVAATDGAMGGRGEPTTAFDSEVLGAEAHGGGTSASRDLGEVELSRDGRSGHTEPGGNGPLADAPCVQPGSAGADLGRGVAPAEARGVAPAAEGHPSAAQPRVRSLSGPAEAGGDVVHPFAALVGFSRVTEVVRADFAGHVYNLQTAGGVYLANGILVHNCRCRVQYRSITSGRFVPKPRGQIDRRPRVKVLLVRHPHPLPPVQVTASRVLAPI